MAINGVAAAIDSIYRNALAVVTIFPTPFTPRKTLVKAFSLGVLI